MKLENILELFLKNLHTKGASPHTIKAYKLDLLDYLKHLKENECSEEAASLYSLVVDATSIEFKSYKEYLGQSSPATIQRKFITLRRFLSWCLKEGFRKNPVPEPPKLPSSQPLAPRWLKRNELNSLFRLVEKQGNKRNEAIVQLLFHTGLRVSELVSLTWEDIHIGRYEGLLTVKCGKGQKKRFVPLNATARKVLLELKDVSSQKEAKDFLFHGKRGPLNENGVLKLFYTLSSSLSMDTKNKITPHRLRHTFCKTLLDKKESIEKVSTLAGHSSLSTTQKYITPSIEDLKLSVDSLMD
ncbi:tyrosine-type recombinase/integrase [Fluviispira vulneris]|uniref:tyrosine-type recombinase/integrase n=1 Tax=Fluviispira vulneris TaxID=2763012 RepID=UPI001648086A|nr:tyrosine-type recombinase/integrase [Fluviispira vulneris]